MVNNRNPCFSRCMLNTIDGPSEQVEDYLCDPEDMPLGARNSQLPCPEDCVLSDWGAWSPCPLVSMMHHLILQCYSSIQCFIFAKDVIRLWVFFMQFCLSWLDDRKQEQWDGSRNATKVPSQQSNQGQYHHSIWRASSPVGHHEAAFTVMCDWTQFLHLFTCGKYYETDASHRLLLFGDQTGRN